LLLLFVVAVVAVVLLCLLRLYDLLCLQGFLLLRLGVVETSSTLTQGSS
jgi:hypothetical protein